MGQFTEPLHSDSDNFEIKDEASELAWKEWAQLVRAEDWTSDDNSVLGLTPTLPSTRIVLASRKSDGGFLGCVVWNEYDGIAFIGFYILSPASRGLGIGSKIWKRAIERIPKDHVTGLRAVSLMAEKYKANDTPVECGHVMRYTLSCDQLGQVCKDASPTDGLGLHVKPVNDLNEEEFAKLLAFDKEITKRDRSAFLRLFFSFPSTAGCVAIDPKGSVVALAAVTSTSFPDRNLFKLAPVYANSLGVFAAVTAPLVDYVRRNSTSSTLLIHILSGTQGEAEVVPLLRHFDQGHLQGRTLFSQVYTNPIDSSRCYVPHNNSCHFDA